MNCMNLGGIIRVHYIRSSALSQEERNLHRVHVRREGHPVPCSQWSLEPSILKGLVLVVLVVVMLVMMVVAMAVVAVVAVVVEVVMKAIT